jgi:lysyl-tRNA synthetase class 1
MFWLNEIAEKIIEKKDKKTFLVADWNTPSGKAHIGSMRGVVIHDIIRHALAKNGKSAIFQYGFDDFDSMDGFPNYLPAEFKKYMGMSFSNIPSPEKGYKNMGEYFARYFQNVFESLGIMPKIVYTSELYKKGIFNDSIKIALENADKIREIYFRISKSKKDDDWYPLNVTCEKCGKIGTTKVYDYDKKNKLVKYKCMPKMVEWAEGCGHEGVISPFDGNAKLPWKVEWPSKWHIFKNDVEGEGKDHFVAGGSRDVADHIARIIFNENPPFDVPYEHFYLNGKKMSSSKSLGVFAGDVLAVTQPEILKFLMVRTRPKKAIEFNIEGETIPLLYDEYDRCIDAYLADPNSDLGQAYYYSKIGDGAISEYRLRFSKIVYLLQMFRTNIEKYALEEKGMELTKIELQELKLREHYAKLWLDKYAPDKYKFKIQDKMPAAAKDLDESQKEFLKEISTKLDEKKWKGEELHEELHNIKNSLHLDPRKAFSAIYLSLLGKDFGPQAGWLIASLDKKFIKSRFEEIVK